MPSWLAGLLVLAVWIGGAVGASPSNAPPVIVVVRPAHPEAAWPEAEARTAAELRALGMVVVVDAGRGDGSPAALERAARRHGAFAAIRIARHPRRGADLWVLDRVTGKAVLRRVPAGDLDGGDAATVVALGVVELLHASLLELRVSEGARGEMEPSAEVRALARTPPRPAVRLGVRAGAGLAGGPGGLGAAAGPGLGLSIFPVPRLALDLEALVAPLGSSRRFGMDDVRAGYGLWRGLVGVAPVPRAVVSPRFLAGAGVLLAWATARGSAIRRAHAAVAVLAGGVDLAARLTGRLRLHLAVRAGVTFPRVSLRRNGVELARSGRPLLDGALTLEWVVSDRLRPVRR